MARSSLIIKVNPARLPQISPEPISRKIHVAHETDFPAGLPMPCVDYYMYY